MNPLAEAIRERRAILFVGSGISSLLGLPKYGELIAQLASRLNYDPEILTQLGSYLELAEFLDLEASGIGEFRSWMDREWHKSSINVKDSKVHELIVKLKFPLIYTTNYDMWLEKAYDEFAPNHYTKIVEVSDLLKIKEGKTQIIKFHGDFSSDSSIVLTESSYFERLDFEGALDIKLRSDALAKVLLFVGYSLSDINIRYLLFKLNRLWGNDGRRPDSYIYMTKPNPVQERILSNRGITPIVSDYDSEKDGVVDFFEKLCKDVDALDV